MRVRYVEVPKDANDTIVDQLLNVNRFNSKDLLEAYVDYWGYARRDFDAWSDVGDNTTMTDSSLTCIGDGMVIVMTLVD